MSKLGDYWKHIRDEADKGRVYAYYLFVIVVTLIIGTIAIVYIYLFAPFPQLIKDVIFISIFGIITISNIQAIWVAVDYAKRNEPFVATYRDGGLFVGTIMNELSENEKRHALKDGREPKDIEAVAKDVAGAMLRLNRATAPLTKHLEEKGVTFERSIKKVTEFIEKSEPYMDVLTRHSERFKPEQIDRLLNLASIAVNRLDKVSDEKLGEMLGRYLAEKLDNSNTLHPEWTKEYTDKGGV